MSVNKKSFWSDNYYNHPPLTDEMIRVAESSLGIKLPQLYLELLKIQNGGYTQGFVYPMTQRTTWADNHVPLSELFGIVTDEGIRTAQNILDSHYMIEEWGLPEMQVLLNGDGHWWITLDYRNKDNPSIKWIDVECNEEVHIADSFEQFFEGLIPEDEWPNEIKNNVA
jgi:hypothetical protein